MTKVCQTFGQNVLYVPAERLLPSNHPWENRFEVASSRPGKFYTVGQHKSRRTWGCSCQGWRTHRKCKHLTDAGLPNHEKPMEVLIVAVGDSNAAPGIMAQIAAEVPKPQAFKNTPLQKLPVAPKPKRAISFDDV